MTGRQSAIDQVRGRGLTVAEMNVEIVRIMGVELVEGRMPREVRKALNNAVKEGKLGHLKKDGLLKEAYFHPNSINKAKDMRKDDVLKFAEVAKNVFC